MAALSDRDREFWGENGYVIIPNAVPQENLDAVLDAMQVFSGRDFSNRDEWYGIPRTPGSSLLNMMRHQTLWENRQYPRIHQAFAEILGTEKLFVSQDRVAMNPPVGPKWEYDGLIHWDMDSTVRPIPLIVQGVLYLTDTNVNQGGFQCVPGFHRRLEEWEKTQPPDRHPKWPDPTGLDIQPIAGKAGDLVIWHRALLHGNGTNRSDQPRLSQFMLMQEVGDREGSGVLPLARSYEAVVADALGVPQAYAERWLTEHRASDLVHARIGAIVGEHPTYPAWQIRSNGREVYVKKSLVKPVDDTTVELTRADAERQKFPIVDSFEEGLTESIVRIPQPQHAPRLTSDQLAELPDLLRQSPAVFDLGDSRIWDEHHWQHTICGGAAFGRGDKRIWNERDVAHLMRNEFGLELDIEEAELTPLGRKLAGVDSW